MAQKSIQGNDSLAKHIKSRRIELGLTIEEAASRAGVGTKTWYRYESGESIRKDKSKGVCRALNWHSFPGQEQEDNDNISIQAYKNHSAWSDFLENTFGIEAAYAFAAGSDILHDYIKEDLVELSSMPIGTHIGQLDVSWLNGNLPEQFLMHYDYEFLYQMKCTLDYLRMCAKAGLPIAVHSVLEELIIYLCNEEASILLELNDEISGLKNERFDTSEDWIFDLFGDMDIVSFLYSNMYLDSDHPYHFSQWTKQQFYNNSLHAYSGKTAHPFQRNGAPFRLKLSKAQLVN